jgi:protocatechuate 3,4-dioxygenase beta subunit
MTQPFQPAPAHVVEPEGLWADLLRMRRRRALGVLATGALPSLAAAQGFACSAFPSETLGPFPADGRNRGPAGLADALALAGIERPDIRSSVGGARTQARGVPLILRLRLHDVAAGCSPVAGWRVYAWQCDAAGRYSLYHPDLANEDHLRGVQRSDAAGWVSFTTVFPGCYPGRMPHVHFQVFGPGGVRTPARLTSQLAFEPALCREIFQQPDYADSVRPFARLSFERDGVFADGVEGQVARSSGRPGQGLTAELTVGVRGS